MLYDVTKHGNFYSQVQHAVAAMQLSHELLRDGNLVDAYLQSVKAFQASGRWSSFKAVSGF